MNEFLHLVIGGISMGCVYSCLAVALVLIYKTTKHVNLAQGEMATISAYVALAMAGTGIGLSMCASMISTT